MSTHLGTNIVHDGLVSVYDARSKASYDPSENLVDNSTYDVVRWGNVFPSFGNLTPGFEAPDGSPTAVRATSTTGGQSLYRVSFTQINLPTPETFTYSFYVKLISGTSSTPSLTTDLHDTLNYTYQGDLVQGQWVRVVVTGQVTRANINFIDIMSNNTTNYVMDFWGLQLERRNFVTPYTPTTGTPITRSNQFRDIVSGQDMTVFGSTTQWRPEGHFFFENNITNYIEKTNYPMPTQTFTHNVWWRSAYSAGQQTPYTYHIGGNNELLFITEANATVIDGLTKGINFPISVPNMANTWQNFCRTSDRNSGLDRYYLNGVLVGSRTQSPGTLVTSPGTLLIGQEPDGPNFDVNQNLDGDFGYLAIYNNILTANQVRQNYEALRGRFGR
jgi:hypothetical protein